MSCCSNVLFPLPHRAAMGERIRVRGAFALAFAFRAKAFAPAALIPLTPDGEAVGGEGVDI